MDDDGHFDNITKKLKGEKNNIASGLTPVNYTLPLDEWCRYLVTTYVPINWWVGLGREACRHQAHQFLWQNTLHKIDRSTRHLFIEQMALIYSTWSSSCNWLCPLWQVLGFGVWLLCFRGRGQKKRLKDDEKDGIDLVSVLHSKSFIVKFLASTWNQLCEWQPTGGDFIVLAKGACF